MLKIGMPITIELKHSDQEEAEVFRCKLVEYHDDVLYIDYPVNQTTGKTGFFFEGTQFKASFVGKDESVYVFETEVRGRKKLNIPVLALHFPGKEQILRIQRRQYVRVETAVDVSVHPPTGSGPTFTSTTVDISGGGAAVISSPNVELEQEDRIEVWFVIPLASGETQYIQTLSRVVRVWKGNAKEKDKISLEFEEIDENDRQLIIRFCFERQLANRRRGVL
ncbi:flagellar brake protein [Pontibacillus sp. HMF3514]|uniref:flagellar brake protein n=1 Tax=Pontibacillus sp. HMF3514 TaxID=2692425 RepID=UPI00132028A1|nr:flagellar brake domain-containing protein [Pontibacillus sp. HMF3514]QHE52536.1 pilus assembly protein PilZ [Pontibacillus sp. HMF3514]